MEGSESPPIIIVIEGDSSLNREKCAVCSKQFWDAFSLKEHFRKSHRNANQFKCEYCNYSTNYKCTLAKHIKRHFNVNRVRKKEYTCPLCYSYKTVDRPAMTNHYVNEHDVSIVSTGFQFEDIDAFSVWKKETEKQAACRFTIFSGARSSKNCRNRVFRCYRDGFYKSRGQGKRRLKNKGSNKIGFLCPASINIAEDLNTGAIRATYRSTHIGHLAEPERLIPTRRSSSKNNPLKSSISDNTVKELCVCEDDLSTMIQLGVSTSESSIDNLNEAKLQLFQDLGNILDEATSEPDVNNIRSALLPIQQNIKATHSDSFSGH